MVKTIYCHLSERYVTPGQVVTRGYILGKEGTTGSSSAPHLHYEVMYGGNINDYLPVNIPQFCYRCTSF
jgi:murein DD-endopeptidase MepM/ murein hydrolase activator NlpD